MTRILYVEDNDDNVYTLKLRFGLLGGFEVLIAENGRPPAATRVRAGDGGRRWYTTGQARAGESCPLGQLQRRWP